MRVGPTVQFQLLANHLPWGQAASFTALYSHLARISGELEHDSFLQLTAAYDIYKHPTYGHKVALNFDYQKGGLNFTQEEVDTFTIGLGILF